MVGFADDDDTRACVAAAAGSETDGAVGEKLHNSASLTCLMALRHVLYSDVNAMGGWEADARRRIVVETRTRCDYMKHIFTTPDNQQVPN